MEMGQKLETGYRVLRGGDEDAGHRSDYQIAEHGIEIVPKHDLSALCCRLYSAISTLVAPSLWAGAVGGFTGFTKCTLPFLLDS
jgi:hypothetical protein